MKAKTTIILGPPGTGKTTKLIQIMEEEMANGIQPTRIAFCSFTKKATDEARDRAKEKFGFTEKDLPYFRTFHSLAFRELGLNRGRVFTWKHRDEVAKVLGLRFSRGDQSEEGGMPSGHFNGDRYAFLNSFAKARCITPRQVWDELGEEDDELSWYEFERYLSFMKEYKQDKHLLEFQDMIDQYSDTEARVDVDIAIIDEAQDLSTSQWKMLFSAFATAKKIYIAGDDDQAIYQWSGADVKKFLSLQGTIHTLQKSHRLPKAIWQTAHDIAGRISERFPKDWHSKDTAGHVEYHNRLEGVDLVGGNWLLLARNVYHLKALVAHARESGVPYTYRGDSAIDPEHIKAIKAWERRRQGQVLSPDELVTVKKYMTKGASESKIWHEALGKIPYDDVLYYISLLRRKQSLTLKPKVHINTIHGVKGGEADHVLLLTDMTERTFKGMQKNFDAEARVFYVGATRAKESLHIIPPQSNKGFDI